MHIRKNILLFLSSILLCIHFHAKAQNLVPNPGFEMVKKLPKGKYNGITHTKDWLATNGLGDYYVEGARKLFGVPRNRFGKQKAHEGNAYAGICISKNFIEYLETKLTDTLIKDQDYLVEFYVNRANRSIGSVKEFGVLFTKKVILGMNDDGIRIKPSLDFPKSGRYKNKKKWIKFSGVYKAKGCETVLVLGSFMHAQSIGKLMYCHYYIDDVSVIPVLHKADTIISVKTEKSIITSFSPTPGKKITLQHIFFSTNKSELLPESFPELDTLVHYLKANSYAIEIAGHTDNTGKEEHNKILSESRAKAVADYLIKKGIDETNVHYTGYGSLQPIAANDTEEGRKQNRRVEFILDTR